MPKIKEIWCMAHSHLDVGYTHPQPLLLALQNDYIEQAVDLCIRTMDYPEEARFRWTCEATYPVVRWLRTAEPERVRLFKQLVKEGYVSITALPMHTTPCCSAGEALHMLEDLDELREQVGSKITTAVNHDINGQPWPLGQFLKNSGVNFYLTGINIHFGGIPFPRPSAFRWKLPDGRELLTFLGEHYSLFSQFLFTHESDTKKMHEGVKQYVKRLEQSGYDKNFAFLTATNPPQYDNNAPDSALPDLIKQYNAEGHEQKLRFVTPEMLRDKLLDDGIAQLPVHAGDWTDYWNFGCASTMRETRVNRLAKKNLQKTEMLECVTGIPDGQYSTVKHDCVETMILFDEHTWGASSSVTSPNAPETYSQKIHKLDMAYRSADLSAYLLSKQMERLCQNPDQSMEVDGVMVVNPTGVQQIVDLNIPASFMERGRQLSEQRAKKFIPYVKDTAETVFLGSVEMPPYSWRKIPFPVLKHQIKQTGDGPKQYTLEEGRLSTPFYEVKWNQVTGRIIQIYDKVQKRELLDEQSPWAFFELVRETVDTRYQKRERAAIFPRDAELGNRSISCWNHDWKADRRGAAPCGEYSVEESRDCVRLVWKSHLDGMQEVEQRVSFSMKHPRITLEAKFEKQPVTMPEGIYFTFPLKLEEGWQCRYDTMGDYVLLDGEQLGNACRDWLTVDKSISMYDNSVCMTLFCPDAPMVQVGDFHFGREQRRIERNRNPLLLAWPLNNYWDTNFNANQSGVMEMRYEFEAFSAFDPVRVYKESIMAEKLCVFGAAINCGSEETGKFIEGDGGAVPIYMYPSAKYRQAGREAFVLLLKNMTDQEQEYSFTVPNGKNIRAAEVTVQEKNIADIAVPDQPVTVAIPARGMKLVQVSYEK